MTRDRRVDRLYDDLTARERALFVLHAVKEDRDVDRTIVWSIPDAQRVTYSRLVRLINALNCELASVIGILHEQAEKAALRLGWLQTLHLWSGEAGLLGTLLRGTTLPADVRKDVKALLARAPSFGEVPFNLERPLPDRPVLGAGYGDELARALAFALQQSLIQHWRELRAVEAVVEEAREEFGGADPLHPEVRRLLDDAKRTLADAYAGCASYVAPFTLPDPGDDDIALCRKLVERASA